jgi:orotidine-5'-phosphate decarboxylase
VNPVLVALDLPTAEEAIRMAERLAPHVGGFKVGLELLMGPGPATVAAIGRMGKPVFADAKLADIPNTVRAAARQLGALGARWVSVHASGGLDMMRAAIAGLSEGARGNKTGVLAVTVLTSLDGDRLASVGISGTVGKQTARLARLAAEAGAEGVVCAVRELGDVHQVAPGLLRVTPGIRPSGSDPDDQARVATPAEAIKRGADLLVIGRPITRAKDPVAAAKAINEELGTEELGTEELGV